MYVDTTQMGNYHREQQPALCKNEAGENIPLTGIISVVAGDTHTFALTKAGEVYAARKQQLWTIRIRT